jgi:hypothetical protein
MSRSERPAPSTRQRALQATNEVTKPRKASCLPGSTFVSDDALCSITSFGAGAPVTITSTLAELVWNAVLVTVIVTTNVEESAVAPTVPTAVPGMAVLSNLRGQVTLNVGTIWTQVHWKVNPAATPRGPGESRS